MVRGGGEQVAATIGEEEIRRIARARGEISKPTMDSAHMSVDGRSEVGQDSSAITSMKMNCAQNFVNTKLVEGS